LVRSPIVAPTGSAAPPPGRVDAPPARVLLVEDEPSIASFARRGLLYEGFAVDVVGHGHAALDAIRDRPPDVVVLDVMLPGVDGIEVVRRVRAAERAEGGPGVPILMLTARDAVEDRVTGLEVGADDYLVKPFALRELAARIRALLRRAGPAAVETPPAELLAFGDLLLDLGARTASRAGRAVQLTTREFNLLTLFLRHPNQVLPRSLLMERIWGADFYGDSNVLEVLVANLRRALETGGEPRLIQTVRSVGYVLRASE
jgi:two-component system response regulator MprA